MSFQMSNSWERVDVYYNVITQITGGSTTSRKREFTANRHQQQLRKETKNLCNNKFKVVTTPNTATLEYYQSIYTHCKQRFNILDGIEVVKKSVYQYIENRINNYLFGNYNISEVRSNLYNNLAHYSQLRTEDLNSETFATYFQELNFNIIKYCEETYLVHNKSKHKLKQYSKTTPNTPILLKTTAKHLQTPEQETSSKLPLTITSFLVLLTQAQTSNSSLNRFVRPEDFTSLRSPTRQQELLQTSSNLLDFLAENQSEHSETAANEKNNSKIIEEESIDSKNKKDKMTAYITKISEFNEENIETITKAGDANEWNTARMLRTIPYFFKGTAGEWFENLDAFKAVFLEQFTDNNTSITLRIHFHNIKQEPSESDKLIKKVCPHALEDLNSAIQHAKRYEMAMEEANCTKLVNLAIGETSLAAEEKIDQLAKKVENYFTNQQQQQPQRYQPPQRRNQNNFTLLSNNQPQKDLNSAIQHAKRYEMAMEEANCTKLVNLAIGETSLAAEEKIDQLAKKVENYFTNQQQQQPQRYQPPQRRNQNNFTLLSNNQPQSCHYYQQNRSNQHYPPPQQFYYQPPLPAYYPPRSQYPTIPTTIHTTLSINNNRISSNNQLVPQNSAQPRPNHYHTQPSYLTIPEEQNFHHTALSEDRATAQQQNPSYTPTTISPARIAENANLSDIFPFEFEANESPFLFSNAAANEQKAITAMYTEAKVERKSICLILDNGSTGIIITADGIKKTPVGEIDNFPFTLDGIIIPVKVLVIDAPQLENPKTTNLLPRTTCPTPAFEFKPEEEKPIIETFMTFGSTSNWANETEQEHFTPHSKPETPGWNISYSKPEPRKQCPYIPLKYKDCCKKLLSMGACISPEEEYENHTCHLIKRSGKWDNTPCLTCGDMLPKECNWIDVAMALINGATQENVCQMKESEYIAYIFEIAGYNYEDEVEVYHQIASHTYLTKKAQAQQLEQINVKLCEKCIMPCDEQWCPECYALSIPLPSENDENKIEFGEPEATEEIETIPIYLIKSQSALQLKYFNNNRQGIKPEKAHKIDAGYDLR
ncbi:hypothetical protein G9A89_009660 [Geosiphon pyriformis]|nr:hypothetical protein G9A89_009660 [Geosiphon pyriformis]